MAELIELASTFGSSPLWGTWIEKFSVFLVQNTERS
jgi:hypothetical protein